MQRIALVTGATGFIGQRLCGHLRESDMKVRALSRSFSGGDSASPLNESWYEDVYCQLGKDPLPSNLMTGVDTVFHLAGVVHAFKPEKEMEQEYWAVNLHATKALITMAHKAGVRRFIYFSSVKAMAEPGDICADEQYRLMPTDVYGLSKRRAEESVLDFGTSTGIQVTVLRPVLVYGPGVKGNLLKMMQAIDAGRFPPISETGNRRSMVHVDDLIRAAMLVAEAKGPVNGKIYIVTDNRQYSTRQMYEWMCAALDRKIPGWGIPAWFIRLAAWLGDGLGKLTGNRMVINSEATAKLLGSACYSSDRITSDLGYVPQKDFQASLSEMVAHYRNPGKSGSVPGENFT